MFYFGHHISRFQVCRNLPKVLISEVQERLAVWTCANGASLLVGGPSLSEAEVPAETPPAFVPLPGQWICHLTCALC